MKGSSKALLLGLMMAAGAVAAPTMASAGIAIDIDVAPPPLRVEALPAPRVGYVWAPGYWQWRQRGYVWMPGRYMRARRGYHWVPSHWDQRGQRWHHEPGRWER